MGAGAVGVAIWEHCFHCSSKQYWFLILFPSSSSPTVQGAFARYLDIPAVGDYWSRSRGAYWNAEGDCCADVDLKGAGGIGACTVTVGGGRWPRLSIAALPANLDSGAAVWGGLM
jgi:hypothetical protein